MKLFITFSILILPACICLLKAQSDEDFDSLQTMDYDNILREVVLDTSTVVAEIEFVSSSPKVRLAPSGGWIPVQGTTDCLISEVTDNSLTLVNDDGDVFDIRLHPFEYFSEFLEGKQGRTGSIALDLSNKSIGADESIALFLDDTLALGYIWKTATEPLSILNAAGSPLLQQLVLSNIPGDDSIALVTVQALTDEGVLDIPSGEAIQFYQNGIPYQVYVTFSEYLPSIYDMEDSKTGYLLQAVISAGSADEEQALYENIGVSGNVSNQSQTLHPEGNVVAIKVYPNPAQDFVVFDVSAGTMIQVSPDSEARSFILELQTATGESLMKTHLAQGSNKIDLRTSAYSAGVYLWSIKSEDGALLEKGRLVLIE